MYKRQGLSQEALARRMDVSRQAVTKWESGQSAPSTENLFRLAEQMCIRDRRSRDRSAGIRKCPRGESRGGICQQRLRRFRSKRGSRR